MENRRNRFDEPVVIAGPKPLLIEFGVHRRLQICYHLLTGKLNSKQKKRPFDMCAEEHLNLQDEKYQCKICALNGIFMLEKRYSTTPFKNGLDFRLFCSG